MERADVQLGAATLRLLTREATGEVLRELHGGPARPVQLDGRIDAPHSVVMRRLAELGHFGAVVHERVAGSPPSATYSLSESGQALIEVADAAERWRQRHDGSARALWLIADERARAVLLALADRPLPLSDLQQRLRFLARSAGPDKLGSLTAARLLAHVHEGPGALYAATDSARRLAGLALVAGRWEWQAGLRDDEDAADLAELVRLLAPVVSVVPAVEPVEGVCRLAVQTTAEPVETYLAIEDGQLAPAPITDEPQAQGSATPRAWCEALSGGTLDGIEASGDAKLLRTIIASIGAVL